ncbi:MAG TPA: tRNA pseudouridine(38-40) synthase TruA [Acidimicrobiales bacterium]|nr:tRNA pseudouridine(38-40) synthase TruA [Acidimicrobiales bacterium]
MLLAYDGRGFHGMAAQPNQVTVAGALGAAMEQVIGQAVKLTVAGRTDTGVHAWGQVVSFDLDRADVDYESLQRSLNSMLAPAIVVRAVGEAPPQFDARRSALTRRYRYHVLNRETPDPFLGATSWHVPEPLDLRAMTLACDPVIGEHDFSSFCRIPRGPSGGRTEGRVPEPMMVRRVIDARWSRLAADDSGNGDLVRFEIEANSFCQQMVRALVGLMLAIGDGRRRAGEMAAILRARSRSEAVHLAPPHGLCLWAVTYPSDPSFVAPGAST